MLPLKSNLQSIATTELLNDANFHPRTHIYTYSVFLIMLLNAISSQQKLSGETGEDIKKLGRAGEEAFSDFSS